MTNTRIIFTAAVLLFALVSVFVISQNKQEDNPGMLPSELFDVLQRGDTTYAVLDVRTPEEFRSSTGHVAGAQLIPVQELEQRIGELAGVKQKTIAVICRSGHRSGIATRILLEHGFKAKNVAGGIIRWHEESLPVVIEEHP